jgi:hypothetical protein
MGPLQLITFMVASEKMHEHALSALPDAPRVPYEPKDARTPVLRAHLADLLRRTADRVDPCAEPIAG